MAKNKVKDLFDKLEAEVAPQAAKARVMKRNGDESYTAADIEVLEGLEPVAPLTVVKSKSEGANLGFVVRDARGIKYALKIDPPGLVGLDTSLYDRIQAGQARL